MKKLLLAFALVACFAVSALSQGSPPWTIQEIDGSPRVNSPTLIKVTNGTLSCTGKTCTITISGGGGGSPGGSSTQVQYNAAGSFGGISGFTSDGTNVTAGSGNLRATRPRFITSIDDTNGNEVFVITATGSAVNEVTIANAATGNNPTFTASGSDANVGINFVPKGSGTIQVSGAAIVTVSATQTLTNKTLSTSNTVSAALTWTAGVKQTFAPDATTAGINVGSVAGDPSGPSNGDLWYDSTANELTARINGANVALGSGGGSGITIGTTTITSGTNTRVLYNNAGVVGEYVITGTGNVVMSASPTLTGTVAMAAATASGTIVQTSASATAFESGPNGSTNPVFRLVNSTASQATGISITGNAAGSGVRLDALSSGASEGIQVYGKGSGSVISLGSGPTIILNVSANGNIGVITRDVGYYGWASGSLSASSLTADTALGRHAAGVVRVNNGSTGAGGLLIGTSSGTGVAGALVIEDVILRRNAAATLAFGAADAASPVAQTLSVQNVVGGTTDTAGVNWTRAASRGTGTGAGGSHVWQVAPAGSTGSSQNALVTALTLASNTTVTFDSIVTTGTGSTSGTVFNYNSLTTGNGANFSSSSVSSGNVVSIAATGTAAASNTKTALNVATSGANGTSTQTTYGVQISNTSTGTSSTNIALGLSASGGSTNLALNVSAGLSRFASGTESAPGIAWGSQTGTGWYLPGGNTTVYSASGVAQYATDNTGFVLRSAYSIGWSASNPLIAADLVLRRNGAANLALGNTDAASPVAQTLSVQNVVGGTSNTAGVNWTFAASRGTGTGAGGDIIFQTAPAGGSGTTQNTLATAFTIQDDGAVQLKSVTFANLPTVANGYLIYCSDCTIASPCASGGSGALAKGINGQWVCN